MKESLCQPPKFRKFCQIAPHRACGNVCYLTIMQVRWMVVAADRARQGNCRIPGNSRSKHIFFIRNAVVRRRTAKSPRARTAAVFIVHRTAAIWFGAVAPGCITKLPLWPRACQPAVSWNVCCTLCTCRSVSDDASGAPGGKSHSDSNQTRNWPRCNFQPQRLFRWFGSKVQFQPQNANSRILLAA